MLKLILLLIVKVICEYIAYIPCLHSPHSFTANAITCAAVTALKEAVESLKGKVSDRWVMAAAYINDIHWCKPSPSPSMKLNEW